MSDTNKIITVVGGTGFIGRYAVKLLAKAGYTIRVIARHTDRAAALKTTGEVGQIVPVYGDLAKPETLEGKLEGSYAVINLVGVLFESGKQNFSALHAQGAEKLAKLAKAAGAKKFIHISAIGVDKAHPSKYARTKATGEKAVIAAFPEASILRPSIVFGAEDGFYNKFASMAVYSPALPLIGGGNTRFQPVYVMDIARAVLACVQQDNFKGQVFELGGPNVYTFRQILEYILAVTGRKRKLVYLPTGIASIMGLFSEALPAPPLTRDQVKLLGYDNIVSPDAKGFMQLGITPTAAEAVVPGYLARYRKYSYSASPGEV